MFDLGAATRVHVEEAHRGEVWSLAPLPNKTGFVSGAADKTVRGQHCLHLPWGRGSLGGGVSALRVVHA